MRRIVDFSAWTGREGGLGSVGSRTAGPGRARRCIRMLPSRRFSFAGMASEDVAGQVLWGIETHPGLGALTASTYGCSL